MLCTALRPQIVIFSSSTLVTCDKFLDVMIEIDFCLFSGVYNSVVFTIILICVSPAEPI